LQPMQVVFHFQYQKHVYFRNGHIVIGFEFWGGGGAHVTGYQQKSIKAVGFFIYFRNNDVGPWKLSDFLCTYR